MTLHNYCEKYFLKFVCYYKHTKNLKFMALWMTIIFTYEISISTQHILFKRIKASMTLSFNNVLSISFKGNLEYNMIYESWNYSAKKLHEKSSSYTHMD